MLSKFAYIALLADSTSFEVFRPKGRFEEQKHYYDGKNKMYAVKKEVAVMAHAPHYALFFSKGELSTTSWLHWILIPSLPRFSGLGT
jgi:hypothetical protein